MVFELAAEKNVIINGKYITFKAGKLDTTDKDEIATLSKCKGVKQVKAKKETKKEAKEDAKEETKKEAKEDAKEEVKEEGLKAKE